MPRLRQGSCTGSAFRADYDPAATDIDPIIPSRDLTGEMAVDAVISEEMRIGFDRAEVVDRNNLDVLAASLMQGAQDQPTDAPKAVDGYSYPYRLSCRHCGARQPRALTYSVFRGIPVRRPAGRLPIEPYQPTAHRKHGV